MNKLIFSVLIFLSNLLLSNINIKNAIDNDASIRNLGFFGPFEGDINSDSLAKSFNKLKLEKETSLELNGVDKKIKAFSANGALGMHYLTQAYKNIKSGNSMLAVAQIISDGDNEVMLSAFAQNIVGKIYINGELVHEDMNTRFKLPCLVKLRKGTNILFTSIKSYGDSGFQLSLSPNYSQVSGIIKYKNGKKANFTWAGIWDRVNREISSWTRSDENGKYTINIPDVKTNADYELRVHGRDYFTNITYIGKLNSGQNKKIDPVIKKWPVLSGNVLNIDGKGKQVAILVEAIPVENNLDKLMTYTDSEGSFDFRRLRPLKYHLRLHGKNDFKYFLDENGNKRIFDMKSNSTGYKDLEIKIETLAKGTWENITYIDGIQSTYSYTNLIDKNNQLWIGSYTGLSIYDGQDMKNITYEEGLPRYPIFDILEDKDGNIWVGSSTLGSSNGGLAKFSQYSLETVYDTSNGLSGNGVNCIAQDNNGRILVGGTGGFQIMDGDSIQVFDYTNGLANGWISTFFVEGNNIWIGTGDGLVKYNGKKFQIFKVKDGLAHRWVTKIKKAPDGKLWIATQGGVSIYDGISFNNLTYWDGLPDSRVNDIFFDETGVAIIATQGGAVKYNGKTFVRLTPRSLGYDYGDGSYDKISKSKDGIYWISSGSGGGVLKYDPRSLINITAVDSFPIGQIREIVADLNNNLWLASEFKGLIQISNEKIKKTITIKDGLRTNSINDIDIDIYNNIWLATNSGLAKYDGEKIKNYTLEDGLKSENILALYADESGYLWLVTPLGLIKYDGESYSLFDEKDGYPADRSNIVSIDGYNGIVCIGIRGKGISIFENGSFSNYGESHGLTDNRITSIGMDSGGDIWIGSDGSGVFRFDGKEFLNYTTKDGVANPEIFNLYVDDLDKIWIGTYGGGVGVFDGDAWGTIDTRDGLVMDNISGLSSFGETYWFAGSRGVTKYRPLKSSGFVNIKKVQTSKDEFLGDEDLIPKSITGNRVSFTVNAANYNTHKDKQRFRYRIKEWNKSWSKPINDNIIDIVPEVAGSFTFEVQSIDRDMNYSSPAKIDFQVNHPWYREASTAIPFWGFIIIVFALSGYSTQKYNNQRKYSLRLKDEAQKKDREARRNLEEKNSELVESQKAAEAANEAKSTFLANMSHELRTPLNAIIGYSEMLIEDAEDENEDFVPDLEKIHGSGKHLLGLINDILDLSKVESGKMELFIEEFDLLKAIQEVESTVKPLVEKNKNTLEVDFATKNNIIKSDVTKFRQILLNLLSNATKFTKEGIISVKVEDLDEKNIQLQVKDSGIGMNQEQVDKVFKPFTQADEKTTRKFGGTGLGLTITKMFAEMMGGKIDLRSKEGKGTTFIVTLPKTLEDKKTNEKNVDNNIIKDGFKILVIDDDKNAQEMMKRFLEKQDYVVVQAMSGEEGLNLATKERPDLITLDVMMPEMDGWEVLTSLQSDELTKNIPTIMLTMADEPDLGFSLGATDYLTKPIDWEALSGVLNKHQIESDSQAILIVEDDETTRNMLRKSLESNNFKVREAANGKEGLEKVEKSKPGLIILDLMMPEMDGFEFSEELRKSKDWIDIPVVVVTAKDLTKEDHERLKGNVEAIMQKGSYSKKELLSEVGTRIELLKSRR